MLKKFEETFDLDEWEIETDSGWEDVSMIGKTIPYQVWKIETKNGLMLEGADTHIIFDENMNEIYIKDCIIGTKIQTKFGIDEIISVNNLNYEENMYDITVNSLNHRYYSNGILSHNTTIACAYLLWYAMYHPDQTILVVSNTGQSSMEIMQRIKYAYEEMPDHIRVGATEYNKGFVTFENGSRIISRATTEYAGRGLSISILYIDEMAFIHPNIQKEFWAAINPVLSTGGKAIITSTPNTNDDLFATLWFGATNTIDDTGNVTDIGKNGYRALLYKWDEHPDRDEKWADEEVAKTSEEQFRREHGCEFISFSETLINAITLDKLKGIEPKFTMGQVRFYKDIKPNCTYIVSLDPSMGTGGDYAAIQIFNATDNEQIGEWKHNKTETPGQVKILFSILQYIDTELKNNPNQRQENEIYWTFENNSVGDGVKNVILEIGEDRFPGSLLNEPTITGRAKKGFNTNSKTKAFACMKLKSMIEKEKLKVNSKALIRELKYYIAHGTSYAAQSGETDDLVAALLLIVRMMQMISKFDEIVHDNLRETEEDILEPMPIYYLR